MITTKLRTAEQNCTKALLVLVQAKFRETRYFLYNSIFGNYNWPISIAKGKLLYGIFKTKLTLACELFSRQFCKLSNVKYETFYCYSCTYIVNIYTRVPMYIYLYLFYFLFLSKISHQCLSSNDSGVSSFYIVFRVVSLHVQVAKILRANGISTGGRKKDRGKSLMSSQRR